jgi:multisubunit Na+/H+ antiporter MnhB subunit
VVDLDQEIRDSKKGMSPIVKTIVRFAMGIIILFGAYIVLYGHLTPGGGFSGGVMLACAFIILTLAFGKDLALKKMGDTAASILDNSGALAFIVIGILGFTGGFFFLNFISHGKLFQLFSAGIIPLCNIAVGLKVTSSLFAVFIALSIFGRFISKLVDEE